ncbi:hypothetical protein Pth03_67750 [Planotetraspora thailandica]|uniref:AB hydrolase-1 domain-containing protein n=1 Tax=Planotetraspora thailandica TaxID=487172 RepID=A0A8J3Y083_9ACTN|nr:alpha/beta hydrolase [Planotetraspora thailandica]GII58386.1 hypothetical protein Pth03_67750 [Planotetraspora thailandica]
MSRHLTIPTADTRLDAVDTPGEARPLVFLNGGFATQRHWGSVLRRLGGTHRTVTFDARARGKSGTSADYSVRGAVGDIGRVIEATGVERPILVGWSHGATIAVRYAAEHPDQVAGLVLVDGAYPVAMFDEAGKEAVRRQFRRLGPLMRVVAAFGLSARMAPAEAAEVVIELDAVNGELLADFEALECPAVYVAGTGPHSGATEQDMSTLRSAAAKATAANERVSVFATSPVNHVRILSKDPGSVVAAIEEVARRAS